MTWNKIVVVSILSFIKESKNIIIYNYWQFVLEEVRHSVNNIKKMKKFNLDVFNVGISVLLLFYT